MKKYRWWILPAVLVSLVIVTLSYSFKQSEKRDFQIVKNLSVFNSIVKQLDMFYVDTIDFNKKVKEGIDYMLYSLDPYTNYFPEEDNNEMEQMLNNSYGGIGAVIAWDPKLKQSVIAEPYENQPAQKAGLKAGDVLLEINKESLKGKNNEQVSKMLRGDAGSSFELLVSRPGTKQPLKFNITRQKVVLPYIPYYGEVKPKMGYIQLTTFSGKPSQEFKESFLALKKQGITSLIIDLRDNGGGVLGEAVEIAGCFLPKGTTLVTLKGRVPSAQEIYTTPNEPLDLDIPLVVLVNGSTASAAEILAGSLQDLDRAVVIGTRSFGKGLVQSTRQLPYNGLLKLTTAKYYIPSGRCVQAINYSKRKEDGTVTRIPDSLTNVFHTKGGREVRDGGGVTPDIIVPTEKLPNVLLYLIRDQWISKYATQYCLNHTSIGDPHHFQLTDSDYADFINMVKVSDFKYDQETDKVLKALKEMAKFEGYYDGANAEFEALEKKLKHDLVHDLNYFSKDIKKLISIEIAKRYYYQKGGVIESLKGDKCLDKAEEILQQQNEYERILTSAVLVK